MSIRSRDSQPRLERTPDPGVGQACAALWRTGEKDGFGVSEQQQQQQQSREVGVISAVGAFNRRVIDDCRCFNATACPLMSSLLTHHMSTEV